MGSVSAGEAGDGGAESSFQGYGRVVREEVKTNEVLGLVPSLLLTLDTSGVILSLQSLRLIEEGGENLRGCLG